MLRSFFGFLLSFFTAFAVLAVLLRHTARNVDAVEEDMIDEEEDMCDASECSKCENACDDAGTSGCYRLILNTNSKILHTDENCRALRHIQEENRSILEKADPDTLVALGYTVCGICASALRK